MSKPVPRVSIGMPVYNAERFLAQTLESILAQSFADFEIVISDNGSTDKTQSLCHDYAARDSRVRYYRQEVNRGAAWNHNQVFKLSCGEYFKWTSYDDPCEPEFLQKCVALLDSNPSAVLCCTQVKDINDDGNLICIKQSEVAQCVKAHERVAVLTRVRHSCEEVYGLMRRNALSQTHLIAPYTGSDQVLLVEMAMRGAFCEVPEPLLLHRWHKGSSVWVHPDRVERWAWFDPSASGRIVLPFWRELFGFVSAILHGPQTLLERWRCLRQLTPWIGACRKGLYKDLRRGLELYVKKHLAWAAPVVRAIWRGRPAAFKDL